MFEYENFKSNIAITDKDGFENLEPSKGVVYKGLLKRFYKKIEDDTSNSIQPLAAATIGLNNTALKCQGIPENCDLWTDYDAQERYLTSKPTCYLVVGKPGCGAYALGEAMSKKLNCIHLCPKNVLIDEIEQGSVTGKCLKFNMKHNRVIKSDVILSIIKNKLTSDVVKHRGYVLSGLPLISSNISTEYYTNTLYSEEALETVDELLFDTIANLKKKKSKMHRTGSHTSLSSNTGVGGEEEVEEEQEEEHIEEEAEEQSVEIPKHLLDFCTNIIILKKSQLLAQKFNLLQQMQEIFDISMHPDIIVYLSWPDKDLVTKRDRKYFNYSSSTYTFNQFTIDMKTEVRWPTKYTLNDYVSPYDSHIFNPKYYCRHPVNFKYNAVNQICNYKQHLLPFIEDKLTDFDPKHVIRLDARISVHEIMHQFTERLAFLSIKPILIPEPLLIEDPPDEMEDFWNLISETNVIKSGVLTFNRYPSLWYNRCPVELQKRRTKRGLPKFAVSLFKHVYMMSSLEAFVSFVKNPRPYLKLEFLEPICRIVIMGTKSSGKTMISKCLSWIFDSPIIAFSDFLQNERRKKHGMYSKTILTEIIPTIEDARFLSWQSTESERLEELNRWVVDVTKTLNSYVPILIEVLKYNNRELREEEQEGIDESETALLENFDKLRSFINFLPFLDDVDQCLGALQDNSLKQFAPLHFRTITKKPETPVLGDLDVTEAIESYIKANELQKEIEPTNEELMTELNNILKKIDEDSKQINNCYGKFIVDGFPPDLELWDYLIEANLLPDNAIAIIENRELEPHLIENYKKMDNCLKNYQERFALANDPLIVTKLRTTALPETTDVDVQIILHDYFTMFLNTNIREEDVVLDGEVNPEIDFFSHFTASIEKFREDWDSIKLKLEENYKSFIEIELENKSDIEVVEEVLLKLRQSYYLICEVNEDDQSEPADEDEISKDVLTYNESRNLCETGSFCPITYFDYGVLWEGKPELCIKYNNKTHYFAKEECLELFQKDVARYQAYNKPFKHIPTLRLCVVGCIGSGKSTISKLISKELGLMHINFSEIINDFLIPRHFKKVGRQFENIFNDVNIDEEGVTEFQMDEENENLVSDILSNETEIRRMVYNYLERGAPILPVLMQRLLKKLWFELPFKESGFVLDGYPRLPSDVEDMVSCYCLPDLIIELESNSEVSLQRLSQKMYKTWKFQLNEAKAIAKKKLDTERQRWMEVITKNVVAKLILEDVLANVVPVTEEETNELATGSTIIEPNPQGSTNVENNLFHFYNEMIQEYPAPVDQNEWEKAEEARERIDARIEGIFEVEDEGLQSLKDILDEQKIKLFSVNATKPINKVLRLILIKLSNLKNRNCSLFEQTFIINYDIAEMLLSKGFFYFSKFERMCPVYIYENPQTICNPFKIMKQRAQLFPVIHRCHIYFIFNEENLRKFRTDPLKYITCDNVNLFREYPLTIGIIGAPKSGKSVLSHSLAKRFGLMCVSRGKALRYMLGNLHWTESSFRMKKALFDGGCIKSECIIKAVQTVVNDNRTLAYGFVLDGFPESAPEAMELLKAGIYPTFIIDITNVPKNVVDNSQNEIYYDIIKTKPPYPAPLIEYRYTEWSKRSSNVRNWIKNDVQNLHVIDGSKSIWQCQQDIVDYIEKAIPKIHYYLFNVSNTIVPADIMCISDEVFRNRMSAYKNMCPLCLQVKVFKHSGYPLDKKGVIQFRNKFYWICADHIDLALKHPGYLLANQLEIPEIPAVVHNVNVSFVYESGICIVTYAHNLPSQKIVSGSNKFAATFRGKTYLFCSSKCLDMFLAKPHMYCDIRVFGDKKMFPRLLLKNLPNIGYLEQTLANIITDACCVVNVVRPKYPGLSIKLSALLYIGLYLKTHNPMVDPSALVLYEKAAKTYYARCKLITDIGLRLRSMDNPFANYPKCCDRIQFADSGTVRKPPSLNSDSSLL